MKIAVQLFGHLRTFRETAKFFHQNVVDANLSLGCDVDVFIHTWNEIDHDDFTPWNNPKGEKRSRNLDEFDIELVHELYKPKKILFEEQYSLSEEEREISLRSGIKDKRTKNITISFVGANKLRESYEKETECCYDLVVVTRPDILFVEKLNFEYLFRDFTSDQLSQTVFYTDIPMLDHKHCTTNHSQFVCGSDLLLIGGSKAISSICEEWMRKELYLKQPAPEKILAQLIHSLGIRLNLIQYPKHYCWNIQRRTGKYTKYTSHFCNTLVRILFFLIKPVLNSSTFFKKMTYRDIN